MIRKKEVFCRHRQAKSSLAVISGVERRKAL